MSGDVTCDGNHWFLVHFAGEVKFHGTHCGQVTAGGSTNLEYFNNEILMYQRMVEIPVVMDEEMTARATELGVIEEQE